MSREITTIPELRREIMRAKIVYAQLRFGPSEEWVKISKREALAYVQKIRDDADPESFGMAGGTAFATVENGEVSLG